jgi:hypothetical protein
MAMTPWIQRRFTRRALLLCASLAAVALIGGADRIAAGTTMHCNTPDPSGRLFCVTVEDRDGVSPTGVQGSGQSQVQVTAYQFYRFAIENKGGSTLTNGTATVVLTDHFFVVPPAEQPPPPANSKAVFVPSGSASFCSLTKANPNTVTCSLANIPAGTTTLPFVVAYRTSDAPGVKETHAAVTVAFKEGAKKGANPASLAFPEITSLEPNPDESVTWSPPGQDVSLGTSPTFDSQFSVLKYKNPADNEPFVATLTESDGFVCAPTLDCFGELVTTDLPDPTAFSESNLFHLRITISTDVAPGGNINDYVISHQFDDSTSFEILDQDDHCAANPPAATDTFPCFTPSKGTLDNGVKVLIFDIFAFENGGWMPG